MQLAEGFRVRREHRLRGSVKNERSLLRLTRAALPAKRRQAENAALRRAARGLDRRQLRSGGWAALKPGLKRSYERGPGAMREAKRQPSAQRMHAWRKRVNELWCHEWFLAPVGGPAVRGQAKDLHRLADLPGVRHDLGVLRHRLTGDPPSRPTELAQATRVNPPTDRQRSSGAWPVTKSIVMSRTFSIA